MKTKKTLVRVFTDYEYYLNQLKLGDLKMNLDYHYEMIEKKNLSFNIHVHGMIKTPSNFVHVKPKKGWSIKIERCKSRTAWNCYITKKPYGKEYIIQYVTNVLEMDYLEKLEMNDKKKPVQYTTICGVPKKDGLPDDAHNAEVGDMLETEDKTQQIICDSI